MRHEQVNTSASDAGITIEDMRAIPEFAHYSDEELQNMVDTIKEFVLLLFKLHIRENPSVKSF